jgi:DNA-binding LytR/AlgR family response regulator
VSPSPDPGPSPTPTGDAGLRVLVVDDEAPARDDLAWLLEREGSVGSVEVAGDATEALRTLQRHDLDVVFLDVRMPGLHGLDLARVLSRFAAPPKVVFVTAHEEHAVEAFELRAYDYLLKPVRVERLREALDRVRPPSVARLEDGTSTAPTTRASRAGGTSSTGGTSGTSGAAAGASPGAATRAGKPAGDLAVLAVESAGRTRFVARRDVRYAEASGDYTRLHTAEGAYLVRIPLSTLEGCWAAAGFFRIHRSYLVSLQAVTELRAATGSTVVVVDGRELPVSRRQSRGLKDALIRFRVGGTPR